MHLPYACVMVSNCDVVIIRTVMPMHGSWSRIGMSSSFVQWCLAFTLNRSSIWLKYFKKYFVSDPLLRLNANTYNFMNETYHKSLFSYGSYPNGQFGCVLNFFTHGSHMWVWTHQSICTPPSPLSSRASILW